MQVESFHLSPIEKELSFINWCKKRNIKQFLLDFDDTICDTQSIFTKQISKVIKHLTEQSPLPGEVSWDKEIRTINDHIFEQYGVNPNRWNFVVDKMENKYLLHPKISSEIKEMFQEIYITPLQMIAGAKTGLDFLKKTNTPMAIVTHANRDWTWKKYNWLKLNQYLDWDNIFIINENGHKTPQSWQEALNYFKLDANQCAVVGDSPRSDINPVSKIGVNHYFLVKNSTPWSIHQQPVPPQTKILKNLGELIEIGREELV